MKFFDEKKVEMSMCDSKSNLSILTVFEFVQDAATDLLVNMKIDGGTIKKKYNAVWVLSKNNIKFFSNICFGKKTQIECFITQKSAAKLVIDTKISDTNKEVIAYSKIEFCAIDLESGKIKKINEVGVDDSIISYPSECNIEFSREKYVYDDVVKTFEVKSTNIDYIGHMNNVEYVRHLLDLYSAEYLASGNMKQIELNYLKQCYEGDVIDVYGKTLDQKDCYLFRKGDIEIFKAKIERNDK